MICFTISLAVEVCKSGVTGSDLHFEKVTLTVVCKTYWKDAIINGGKQYRKNKRHKTGSREGQYFIIGEGRMRL